MNSICKQKNKQNGFIALMTAVIISAILIGFTTTIGANSFHARFDSLNTEFKRVSLGLAESCINHALLKIAKNYNYTPASGGDVILVGNDSNGDPENCKVVSVTYSNITTDQKVANITTSAEYHDAFSSVSTSATVTDPSVSISRATLFVVTQFINNDGGTLGASSSTMTISGGNPAPSSSFQGSELGVVSTVDANTSYSVTGSHVSGYNYPPTADSNCSGSGLSPGSTVTCVVTYDDIPTTGIITVIANIINDNGGTKTISDFPLYINTGNQVINGVANTLLPGSYNMTGGVVSGYSIKTEVGYCGPHILNIGDNKTCIITYDDDAPPSPICADTVMMLDRTGSMASGDLTGERNAANSLLDLYDNLTPAPKASVGVFGAIGAGEPYLATIMQSLTSNYTSLYTAITNGLASSGGYTNLQSAIQKSQDEFDAHGSFHEDGTPYEHVLILLSDGGANRPNTSTSGSVTLSPSAVGNYDTWKANIGTKVSAVSTSDGDTSYIDYANTNPSQTFSTTGSVPSGATSISVTLTTVAKGTSNGANIQLTAENGVTQVVDGGHNLTTGYLAYTWVMNTNPITNAPWTVSEVNAMKFGIKRNNSGSSISRVTQISAQVNFNIPNNTLLKSPGSTHTPNNWDTNAVANVQSNNDIYASDNDDDQQGYSNFSLGVPVGAVINGMEVAIDGKSSDASGCQIGVNLSWNGSSYATGQTFALTNSDTTHTFGSPTTLWAGHAWVASDFSDTNFVVRVEGIDPGGNCDNTAVTSLDLLQVKIYYGIPGSTTLSPSSTGTYDTWTANTGTKVNAVLNNDGDATYVENNPSQTFAISNAVINIPLGATATVDSIVLKAVAKGTSSGASLALVAENGSNLMADLGHNLSTSYATYSWTMNNNPFTLSPWTFAEVKNWSTKFGVQKTNIGSSIPRVSQLQLVVNYTITFDPYEAAYQAADSAKLADTKIFTIHFGSAGSGNSDQNFLATLASGTTPNPPHEDGSLNENPGGVVNADTGYKVPTSQSFDTGGDGNGFEINPASAYADDDAPAQNIDGAGDRHRFYGYDMSLPPNANIKGVELKPNWWLDSISNTNSMSFELSWNGGSTWTSMKTDSNESTSHSHTATLGGSTDLWGRSKWLVSDFSSTNFRVRVTSNSNNSQRDFFLDYLPVRIYYSAMEENTDGDNFYISPSASDMSDIFTDIGKKVCPAAANPIIYEPPTTATLYVGTHVINDNTGTLNASDFTMNISAVNPSLTTFTGVEPTGVAVTVDPGAYIVDEGSNSGYQKTIGAGCSGTISAGEIRTCVITNDDLPEPLPPPPAPPLNIDIGAWQETP